MSRNRLHSNRQRQADHMDVFGVDALVRKRITAAVLSTAKTSANRGEKCLFVCFTLPHLKSIEEADGGNISRSKKETLE